MRIMPLEVVKKQRESGPPLVLSRDSSCTCDVPLRGFSQSCGSDPLPRLCGFWRPTAPNSTNNLLSCFYPFVHLIQRLWLVSWSNEFFLVIAFLRLCSQQLPPSLSLTEKESKNDSLANGFSQMWQLVVLLKSPQSSYSVDMGTIVFSSSLFFFFFLLQNRLEKLFHGIYASAEFLCLRIVRRFSPPCTHIHMQHNGLFSGCSALAGFLHSFAYSPQSLQNLPK